VGTVRQILEGSLMRKVFATQAVFAAIAAVGMNGCGKSVDKDGTGLAQFQAGSPVSTQGGCDIVGVPQAQEIRAFSEISQPQGTYDLVSFAAVSMKRA